MYYYIGATHRGDQRFYGAKYREYRAVFVAGIDGPANEGLGPAETCSLEQFLQDKCKRTAYEKYAKTRSSISPFVGRVPDAASDLFGVCGIWTGRVTEERSGSYPNRANVYRRR